MSVFKQFRLTLPFIVSLLIFILLWRGLTLHPTVVPSPLVNKPAPTFQLPTLIGTKQQTTNHDLMGHVTLVNVWATWCVACAEEHDFLLQLAASHSPNHLMLYGLNYKDDATAAKKWLQQRGNPYQIIAVDPSGNAAIDWGVYGTPETFILDKKGIIRYKQIGPITAEIWGKQLQPLVEKLQSEPA